MHSDSAPSRNPSTEGNSAAVQMEVGNSEGEERTATPTVNYRDPGLRPVYKLSVKLIDTYKYINKVARCHTIFKRVNLNFRSIMRPKPRSCEISKTQLVVACTMTVTMMEIMIILCMEMKYLPRDTS